MQVDCGSISSSSPWPLPALWTARGQCPGRFALGHRARSESAGALGQVGLWPVVFGHLWEQVPEAVPAPLMDAMNQGWKPEAEQARQGTIQTSQGRVGWGQAGQE